MNTYVLDNKTINSFIMNDLMPNENGIKVIQESVEEFANTFDTPDDPVLWYSLIVEEVFEFYEEYVMNGVTPNLLKEYADVLYVIAGLIRVLDRDHQLSDYKYNLLTKIYLSADVVLNLFDTETVMEAFNRVHLSNMSKLDKDGNVLRHASGKVMKSDLYQKPNLNDLVNNAMMVEKTKKELGA